MLGKTLRDRYSLIKIIGGGGFGDTYLAKDLHLPRQPLCVVKHLKPKNPDPDTLSIARRLFATEADILYRLKHDRIPQLLAHFEENGEFYLVQEYIDGDDLSKTELSPGNKLTEKEAIALLQDILEVLAFVHHQNVIHRDLKPSNLIRRRADNKVVLIDFGAVKEIHTLSITTQGQTSLTVAVGTLGYMPSEQSSGQPQLCSDVYAVGAIGIQALTGISPFQLPKDPKTLEILWRDRVQVSKKLADILDKMCRYHFDRRYPSAVEALQAIATLKPQQNYKLIIGSVIGIAIVSILGVFFPKIQQLCCQPTIEFGDYKNSTHGIEIKYPKNWNKQAGAFPFTPDVTIFQSPLESDNDKFQEQLIVNIVELDNPVLLDDYAQKIIADLKTSLNNLEVADRCDREIVLANGKTNTVCYTARDEGRKLKYLLALTLNGDRVYYLTYIAEPDKYDKFLGTVKEMMKSFQIVDSK